MNAPKSVVITGVPDIIASTATPPNGSMYCVGMITAVASAISFFLSSGHTDPTYSRLSPDTVNSHALIVFPSCVAHCHASMSFFQLRCATSTAICTPFLDTILPM